MPVSEEERRKYASLAASLRKIETNDEMPQEDLDRLVEAANEDVIIHKLIAWRAREVNDIDSILMSSTRLDDGYIRTVAREWEVEDRWDESLLRRG
jgi:hypothetical protein